jgi:hypothetical protein
MDTGTSVMSIFLDDMTLMCKPMMRCCGNCELICLGSPFFLLLLIEVVFTQIYCAVIGLDLWSFECCGGLVGRGSIELMWR